MVRALVRGALEKEHHRIVEARDGRDALGVLETESPDLIVTDINMPEMDGLSLIEAVRQLPQHECTPIMVLSNEPGDDIRDRCKRAGAIGWLDKPFHPDNLCRTARFVLDLRQRALARKEGGKG
jgi:two-component system chemotaxis response regulator CheY